MEKKRMFTIGEVRAGAIQLKGRKATLCLPKEILQGLLEMIDPQSRFWKYWKITIIAEVIDPPDEGRTSIH